MSQVQLHKLVLVWNYLKILIIVMIFRIVRDDLPDNTAITFLNLKCLVNGSDLLF